MKRSLRVVRYTPAGTPNQNPDQFEQRVRSFTAEVASIGATALVVQRDGASLRYYAILPEGARTNEAERNLHESLMFGAFRLDVTNPFAVQAADQLHREGLIRPRENVPARPSGFVTYPLWEMDEQEFSALLRD